MGTPEETTSEEIRTPEEGQREIGLILEKEKAFIYVDNALEQYPFEQLLPKDTSKAKKLRLLITTRDRDVGRECSKLKPKIYPMKVLPHIEAKMLLEKQLYGETDNMEKPLSSSQLDQMVEMCGCIPKLLIVAGGFIRRGDDQQEAYGRVKEERERNWKGEIGKDIAHYVFAYQNLEETLKDPFLDICSFFNGWEWSEVADRLGDSELNSLEKRALVTGKTEETRRTVWVHDVILAMGLQQAEGTRFSSANKLQEFLDEKEDKEIGIIKGIMLPSKDWLNDCLYISASKLDLMCTSLRLFDIRDSAKVKGKCEKTLEKLLYFKGQIFDLPFDVSRSKELRYLDFSDDPDDSDQEFSNDTNIEKLLGSISKLGYLRVLKLSCKLRQLPKDFGPFICLQKLHLDHCRSLEALPSSLGNLSSLKLLDLSRCRSLKDLPCELGKLTSLAELRLSGCSELEALPSSLVNLSSLRLLDLSECRSLKDLACELEKLTSLAQLRLSGYSELEALPSSLVNLSSLRLLDLSEWRSLKDLPCELGMLTSLAQLRLSGCSELEALPSSLVNLSSLRLLDLSECRSLKDLPCELGKLTSLAQLGLSGCSELSSIPVGYWVKIQR